MKTLSLIEYRHPRADFTLPLPAQWQLSEDIQPHVALVVVEPPKDGGFRANLVVTVEPLAANADLQVWQDATERHLPDNLSQFMLLDRELLTDGPYPIVRRLAHHEGDGQYAVTMEQWAMAEAGYGYVITFSVGTLEYDAYADLAAEAATKFVPGSPRLGEDS